MEPVTTMMLVSAFSLAVAGTQRPKWENGFNPTTSNSTLLISPPAAPSSQMALVQEQPVISLTPKERIFGQLMSYIPDGTEDPDIEPVSQIEHILVANQFLRLLPGSFPLPTLMRNDEGEIGMYWDNDDAYIDMDIKSENTFSLYVRVRSTKFKEFIEDISIEDVNANWFAENLKEIAVHNNAIA